MNLENVRSSFVIYLIDNNEDRSAFSGQALKSREFQVSVYESTVKALEGIEDNPPHIIFVSYEALKLSGGKFVQEINEVSPESRVIILASREKFSEAYSLFDAGVFDFIFSDFFKVGESEEDCRLAISNILKSADHAVEMDFYKFKNEQLLDEVEKKGGSNSELASGFSLHNIWLQKLEKCDNFTASVDCFMLEISRYLGARQITYLKYIPSYRSLVSSRSVNVQDFTAGHAFDLKSMFKNNNIEEDNFENSDEFRDKIYNYTLWGNTSIIPFRVNGDLKGVFIIDVETIRETDSFILACLNSLALKVSNIFLERKLHTSNHIDEGTGVNNRKYLLTRLKEEVSRSRRIQIPVSFVLISFDNFSEYFESSPVAEVDNALRMLGVLLEKSSRVNDIVGRVSSDEFGLILAHTPYEGALIKAERIRQLIESTDFTQVASEFTEVTVSIGVSEYPSHCSDVESMLEQADNAMIEVSRYGGNQVCLSSVPIDFNPDYNYAK